MIGPSVAVANGYLDATLTTAFVQLHVGPPGPRGVDNVAANNIRKPITFDRAEHGEAKSNVEIVWDLVPATETYVNITLWDALTGGRFLHSGVLSSAPVDPTAAFALEVGAVTCSMQVAS